MGQTTDTVDCNIIGTCTSKPVPRFLITLGFLVVPLGLLVVGSLYFIHKYLSMESELVDYWWRIQLDEIEFIVSRRKKANDGALVANRAESTISSAKDSASVNPEERASVVKTKSVARTTDVRTTTGIGTTIESSAADVCYGDISLGKYKQTKVAVKPIVKYHQSRKLMLELRTVS